MLIGARQLLKIRLVFYTLYLWNEVRDPPFFRFSKVLKENVDANE